MIKLPHYVCIASKKNFAMAAPARILEGMPFAITQEEPGRPLTLTLVPQGYFLVFIPDSLQARDVRRAITQATSSTGFDWRKLWKLSWRSIVEPTDELRRWVKAVRDSLYEFELKRVSWWEDATCTK